MEWRTRKRGTPRQIGLKFPIRVRAKVKSLFYPNPRHRFIAENIHFTSITKAEQGIRVLEKKFDEADPEMQLAIIRALVLASNRCKASLRRRNLTPQARRRYLRLTVLFSDAAQRLRAKYRGGVAE